MQPEPEKQQPSLSPNTQAGAPQPLPQAKKNPLFIGAIAAVVLGAASFFLGLGPFAHHPDDESQQQIQQRTQNLANAVLQFPTVDLNDPAQKAKALAALHMPAADAQKVMDDAQSGKVKLAWVTVWDDCQEDGDVVQVSSQGASVQVTLMNSPTTVVLPVVEGGSLQVIGVKDGMGGGITCGIKSPFGDLDLPPLTAGQVVSIPVK